MNKEKQTVLVVDDQAVNRQILRHMLETDYDILEAPNGADALAVLEQNQSISAVILDIVMPVMDGYAFLERLRGTDAASVPVIAVTATKDEAAEQKALDLGAWDFISKPYHITVLQARLKNVIVRSQFYLVNEMKYVYEHDALTGLYNRTGFFTEARRLLDRNPDGQFAMLRFDIDNFHLLNSFWGEEAGNAFLRFIADGLRRLARTVQPCVYARINADTFGICLLYDLPLLEKLLAQARTELAAYNTNYPIKPTLGIYVIGDRTEKIEAMYERATLAARECKGKYERVLCVYEDAISRKMEQEQRIVAEMQHALDSEQFEVFLQPKYNLETEKPYGAEALVRWRHPEKGLLSPGVFIPVFERNGFIGKVDRYMWEHVCRLLRRWIDAGQEPAPISVNVSRVNLYNPNLARQMKELVDSYGLPPRLLNLELTESAYMDDPALMSRTVRQLQDAGFTIMMDDFGSGYSSLNTLKDLPVNILKIDMKFLSAEAESSDGRNECILASVIRMAGWLEIPVIMEGVETEQQVNFLKSIGCGYVQGFYFAKPMPVDAYEKLVDGVTQRPALSHSENHAAVFHTVWTPGRAMDLLFNSIGRPAAIYEFSGGSFRALRVNALFNACFGYGRTADDNLIMSYQGVSAGQMERVLHAFEAAVQRKGSAECDYSLAAPAGRRVHLTLRYWGANERSAVLFATFSVQDEG